jgi:hypothetical protein
MFLIFLAWHMAHGFWWICPKVNKRSKSGSSAVCPQVNKRFFIVDKDD